MPFLRLAKIIERINHTNSRRTRIKAIEQAQANVDAGEAAQTLTSEILGFFVQSDQLLTEAIR
jgi:hypothetical protein